VQRWIALITNRATRLGAVGRAFTRLHAAAFTRSGGRIGRGWLGAPVLVLATVGRRSGSVRETPLLYVRDGDALALLAANSGNDRVPAWWLNLQAAETAEVVVRGRRRRMRWREATGEDYERLFAAFVAVYPPAAHYRGFTDRHMPIAVLTDAGV
jgi:deazaflavin-dependent oxidoreductase (nitroreductase family)